jgi:hypothetical protein
MLGRFTKRPAGAGAEAAVLERAEPAPAPVIELEVAPTIAPTLPEPAPRCVCIGV